MKKQNKTVVTRLAAASLALGIAFGPTASAIAQDKPPAKKELTQSYNREASRDKVERVVQAVKANAAERRNTAAVETSWNVELNPLIPVLALAGLGGLYGIGCLLLARRRPKGTLLRVFAGAVIAGIIANPQIVKEDRERLLTEVAIVLDKSASQSLGQRGEMTQEMYQRLMKRLGEIEGVNIRTIEVGNKVNGRPVDGTQIFTALQAGLENVPRNQLGAVIVLTDGRVHDIPKNLSAIGKNVPLHVLVSGHDKEVDRRIVVEQAPRFGLVNKDQTIRYRVVDDGKTGSADKRVRVTISSNGQILHTALVPVGRTAEATIKIAHAGRNSIELKVEKLDGELTTVNNRVVTEINGIRQALKVLLISGSPGPSTRTWRQFLKADADTNLIHFTILRQPHQQDDTPLKDLSLVPFPAQELFLEKIQKFDLIIMDRFNHSGVLPSYYMESIMRYVKNGGALLITTGPEFSPNSGLSRTGLSKILPVTPNGKFIEREFRPRVTGQGQRHPVIRGLRGSHPENPTWGPWFGMVPSQHKDGHILMKGPNDMPLLVLKRQDDGRVAMLMSNNVWLWAQGIKGGGPHAELLRRLSHWLMKDPSLSEEAIKMYRNADGKLVIEQQSMADKAKDITIRTPSGKTIKVTPEKTDTPGIWRAAINTDELGLYTAVRTEDHKIRSHINIGPANPQEFAKTISTLALMQQIARESQGGIERMTKNGALSVPSVRTISADATGRMAGKNWIGIRMTDATILRGMERNSLIPPWLALLLAASLIAGVWYREGEGKLFGHKGKGANDQEQNQDGDQGDKKKPQVSVTPTPNV